MPLTAQAAVAQRADFKTLLPISLDKNRLGQPVLESSDGTKHKAFVITAPSGQWIGEINYSTSGIIGIGDHDAAQALAEYVVLAANAHAALVEYFNASLLLRAVVANPHHTLTDERTATVQYEAASKAAMMALAGKS